MFRDWPTRKHAAENKTEIETKEKKYTRHQTTFDHDRQLNNKVDTILMANVN